LKKFFATIIILFFIAKVFSQVIPQEPPYKRFPEFPPVKLLLPDSTNYFTKDDLKKKSAVMLILFSPDCDHCREETEELLKNIDQFQKVQIVMATFLPFEKMRFFIAEYELNKYSNIVVGQDFQYFLSTFYMIKNLPFHAFYNKKKELISVFEGSMSTEKILKELEK
jgi:hypothetical protein